MKLTASYSNHLFEITKDLPEVGFYLYVYDNNGKNIHDSLQDNLQKAKEVALHDFGVPLESWRTTQ